VVGIESRSSVIGAYVYGLCGVASNVSQPAALGPRITCTASRTHSEGWFTYGSRGRRGATPTRARGSCPSSRNHRRRLGCLVESLPPTWHPRIANLGPLLPVPIPFRQEVCWIHRSVSHKLRWDSLRAANDFVRTSANPGYNGNRIKPRWFQLVGRTLRPELALEEEGGRGPHSGGPSRARVVPDACWDKHTPGLPGGA